MNPAFYLNLVAAILCIVVFFITSDSFLSIVNLVLAIANFIMGCLWIREYTKEHPSCFINKALSFVETKVNQLRDVKWN